MLKLQRRLQVSRLKSATAPPPLTPSPPTAPICTSASLWLWDRLRVLAAPSRPCWRPEFTQTQQHCYVGGQAKKENKLMGAEICHESPPPYIQIPTILTPPPPPLAPGSPSGMLHSWQTNFVLRLCSVWTAGNSQRSCDLQVRKMNRVMLRLVEKCSEKQ